MHPSLTPEDRGNVLMSYQVLTHQELEPGRHVELPCEPPPFLEGIVS